MNPRRPLDTPPANDESRPRIPFQHFESWIDRQIRQAIDAGAFDKLAGHGEPLAEEDQGLALAGEDGMGLRLLKKHDALPAWIELNREIARDRAACNRILAHYQREHDRAQRGRLADDYRRRARQLNEKIASYNLIVPAASLEQVIVRIDLDLRDADHRRWSGLGNGA